MPQSVETTRRALLDKRAKAIEELKSLAYRAQRVPSERQRLKPEAALAVHAILLQRDFLVSKIEPPNGVTHNKARALLRDIGKQALKIAAQDRLDPDLVSAALGAHDFRWQLQELPLPNVPQAIIPKISTISAVVAGRNVHQHWAIRLHEPFSYVPGEFRFDILTNTLHHNMIVDTQMNYSVVRNPDATMPEAMVHTWYSGYPVPLHDEDSRLFIPFGVILAARQQYGWQQQRPSIAMVE